MPSFYHNLWRQPNPDDIEWATQQILLLRIKLFQVTVGDKMPLAALLPSVGNWDNLNQSIRNISLNNQGCEDLDVNRINMKVENTKSWENFNCTHDPPYAILNCHKAQSFDSCLCFPDFSTGEPFFILIQDKQRTKSSCDFLKGGRPLTRIQSVKSEHTKVSFVDEPHIFLIVSDSYKRLTY
jgi:hypothetical protein